jgi:hypothetical protein
LLVVVKTTPKKRKKLFQIIFRHFIPLKGYLYFPGGSLGYDADTGVTGLGLGDPHVRGIVLDSSDPVNPGATE